MDIVGEAKAIAVQMNNDTMAQTDWDAAAQAVGGFFDQLLSLSTNDFRMVATFLVVSMKTRRPTTPTATIKAAPPIRR